MGFDKTQMETDLTTEFELIPPTKTAADAAAGVASAIDDNFTDESPAQEGWHDVGGAGEPAFQNSWAWYAAGTKPGFWVDSLGIVHLRGIVRYGTAGLIFTLPAGYRPEYGNIMTAQVAIGDTRLDVATSGDVTAYTFAASPANYWVSMDGLTFRAYQ